MMLPVQQSEKAEQPTGRAIHAKALSKAAEPAEMFVLVRVAKV